MPKPVKASDVVWKSAATYAPATADLIYREAAELGKHLMLSNADQKRATAAIMRVLKSMGYQLKRSDEDNIGFQLAAYPVQEAVEKGLQTYLRDIVERQLDATIKEYLQVDRGLLQELGDLLADHLKGYIRQYPVGKVTVEVEAGEESVQVVADGLPDNIGTDYTFYEPLERELNRLADWFLDKHNISEYQLTGTDYVNGQFVYGVSFT